MLPLFLLSTLFPSLALAADVCNGHAELCSKSYSDVTFLGAHDSYAVGTSLADDQSSDVTTQLVGRVGSIEGVANSACCRMMEYGRCRCKRKSTCRCKSHH